MIVAAVLVLAIASVPAQQAPTKKYYTEGQEVRVCGEVKTIRTSPPACDTTIRVTGTGEEFDVVLPISVSNKLSIRPQALQGAQACFTGRIAVAPGIPKVNVASATAVELVSTLLDPSFGADAAIPCGSNVTMPRVLKEQKPQYTSAAMRAKVQGAVVLHAIVNTEGTVIQARVVKPLHPDLDEQALLAAKQWLFVPGNEGRQTRTSSGHH